MTFDGLVTNGVIVLPEGMQLPDGTLVRITPVETKPTDQPVIAPLFSMGVRAVETGITDLATNVDHYLYGHPKSNHAD